METWALVVGINEYAAAAEVTDLKGAVADATEFADWALDANGGRVQPERLFFKTSPAPDLAPAPGLPQWVGGAPAEGGAPTRRQIVETGLLAARQARRLGQPARIYVFLAGHGVQSNEFDSTVDRQTCFITGDFERADRIAHGVLPCQDFRRLLLADGFAEVVMFLDCCRSPMTRLDQHIQPLVGKGPESDLSWAVGHATLPGGIAWEIPDPGPTRGAFTSVLVQGLRTVREAGNVLTLEGLRHHVKTNIGDLVKPKQQRPQFDPDLDLVILKAPPIEPTAPVEATFAADIKAGLAFDLVDRTLQRRPLAAAPGQKLTFNADAGQPYSIESSDGSIITTFDHPGPHATIVTVP